MYIIDSEGYFKLTYPYSEAETPWLLAAVDLLKQGGIDYKVIQLSNGSREVWRRPSRPFTPEEVQNA